MNTLSLANPPALPATPLSAAALPRRGLGVLLILEGLLSLAPVVVLGPAIGWPASLDNPAAQQLAAIARQPDALALGYGLYLLYSVLIAPLMVGLAVRFCGGLQHPLGASVATFGALSALARSIGILRWLTVMPALAGAHAAADPAARVQIERLFDALNSYGGGIGEVLGVSLFMAFAMGLLGIGAWRAASMPRWLAAAAVVSALGLAALALPNLRIAVEMPVAAAVSLLSLWMLCAGVWLLRAPRR
jgi:hypothetical protein